jgi:hypothetical protein
MFIIQTIKKRLENIYFIPLKSMEYGKFPIKDMTRLALSPWAEDPVVVEYLVRIEQDRVRFRLKRGV